METPPAAKLKRGVTLRRRIAAGSAFAVAVAIITVSTGAWFVARSELYNNIDAGLTRRLEYIRISSGVIVTQPPVAGQSEEEGVFGPGDFDAVYYQIITEDGQILVPLNQPVLPVSNVVPAKEPIFQDIRTGGTHLRMVIALSPQNDTIQIARTLTETDRTLAGIGALLGAAALLGMVLAAGLGAWVAREALKPVKKFTLAAEEMAETQQLEQRIPVTENDEIGRLGVAINSMLEALDDSRIKQQRLVRDAGHELRTPLTSLQTNVELLEANPDLPIKDRSEILTSIVTEVSTLTVLVKEIVDVASDRYSQEEFKSVRLDKLARQTGDLYMERSGRIVEYSLEKCVIKGRENALKRCLDNLINNAGKWSPTDSIITIGVTSQGELRVVDQGDGIDSSDLDRVFDRFYRSSKARPTPGSGLGLSIVKHIVEEHDGTITIESEKDQGTIVIVNLPCKN